MASIASDKPIVLFDGECSMCSRSVDWLIRHDQMAKFKVGAQQTDAGRRVLEAAGRDPDALNTVVLIEGAAVLTKTQALIRIAARLPRPWSWFRWLWLVPRPIRDRVYDFVARNRFKWFPKRETCRVPTPAERDRFID